ncbi:MAG TPA: NUDIX domain-containing protein [Candidatus Saccharimonadales bacterium]|nr:NUDIX domain-containing protein [Candidatus Saccharimonadales bacterium]
MKQIAAAILLAPDGHVILQRRTEDDLTKPNKLALFGGHMEEGETPGQTIDRELKEETSLTSFDLEKLAEQHWYVASVGSSTFTVYEGAGAEIFTVDEALAHPDITYSTRYALERLKYDRPL